MSAHVTQSDIDAADERAAELCEQVAAISGRLRWLRFASLRAGIAGIYYHVVLAARSGAERIKLWRGGVVLLTPLIFGVVTFIASDMLTSDRNMSIFWGLLGAVVTAIAGYVLLLRMPPEDARSQRDEARQRRLTTGRQVAELKRQRRAIAKEQETAQRHYKALLARREGRMVFESNVIVTRILRGVALVLGVSCLGTSLFLFLRRDMLESVLSPPAVYYLAALWIVTCFVSAALANSLNRSGGDWFTLTLIVPFLAPVVLSVLDEGKASENPYGGFVAHFFAVCFSKHCSNCGNTVPLSSQAGEHCPFCGAYWSFERTIYRD